MPINNPKKLNIVDDIHGLKIPDPYRWLEDVNDPEVNEWIDANNLEVNKEFKDKDFDIFSKELAKNFKSVSYSNPAPVCGKYFYTERNPDEDQSALYVKNGLNGTPIKLFDPNGKKDGNTVTIDYWHESYTGKFVSYGVSEGGDEMSTIYIKNVETNTEIPDRIPYCRYSTVRWLPDDSGFYYTRNPKPGTVPKNEETLHIKVYLHMLGDNPDNDELIFGEGRPKDDMIKLGISLDGNLLCIQTSTKWTENDVYIYNREKRETRPLVTGIMSIFSTRLAKDKVLLLTNYKANNYRVLWSEYSDMFKPIDEWKELIPEREFLLESIMTVKDKILVEYLVNVCSELLIFDYSGKEIGKIPLPKLSSLAGISGRREESEFFYGVDSFIFPKITYRYDPKTNSFLEYRVTDNPINPNEYEVEQVWYQSKDNTKIPMFIIHKRGFVKDGKNPTILYGYGGFGTNEMPKFLKNSVPWFERGGIFAIANIRGGGEFGEKWHKAGIKEKKQNSYDDFIAAAEFLIKNKYTDNKHLGMLGGSNGGLLVSAVAVQRPDLFAAVCSKVPLTDMVRFHKFGMAMRWVHEYGDPEIKEDLLNILKWSPYHNVKDGRKLPDFLFTTANKDTRVDPLHARKMAAMIKGSNKENNVFVLTEMEAGHGPGKPIIKIVENQGVTLSFFSKKLGLRV